MFSGANQSLATSWGGCAGNQFARAASFVTCYANVFATVFARALAEATASAGCFIDGGDAAATAAITAEVGADVYQYEYCDYYIVEDGPADGEASGFSGTFVVRCACSCCAFPAQCARMLESTGGRITTHEIASGLACQLDIKLCQITCSMFLK